MFITAYARLLPVKSGCETGAAEYFSPMGKWKHWKVLSAT